MAESSGEKSEEASEKKIEDSRKKGQVWQSKDFSGVLSFSAALFVVKLTWSTIEEKFSDLFRFAFDKLIHPEEIRQATFGILLMGVITLLRVSIPIVGAAAIIAGLTDFLQVGPLLALESIKPKLQNIDPIAGAKNLFSKKGLMEMVKSIAKISVAAYVALGVVKGSLNLITATINSDVRSIQWVMGELISRLAVRIGMCFVLFALIDIWWQRKAFMKDLMMTKDEVKREYKESEGSPEHKAKRKELHQEILEGSQMEAVKGADVVVTNPEHVAVAIKYDRSKDVAPRVLAKGFDARAQAIKAIAKDAGVALLRNVPLAHALFRVEVGEEIPEDLYDAVAEILNFVYNLRDGVSPADATKRKVS